MYNENQLVKTRWNNLTKSWYESKGYIFTKRNDELIVAAKDLCENSSVHIKAVCDYCGKEYKTQYAIVTKNKRNNEKECCPFCTGLKASDKSLNKRAIAQSEKLQRVCKQYNYQLLSDTNEYINAKSKIEFICPKHGYQSMMMFNLLQGHECIACSYEKRRNKSKHSTAYVKKKIETVNGNKLLNPNDYKNSIEHNLHIKCKCGNVFTTSFSNYTRFGVNQCFSCSNKESKAESRIKNHLSKNNILFIQEKRFQDCRDIKPLPFDFYLPSHNIIIEFDGQHHFYPIRGVKQYNTTKIHDKIKNEYCQLHNIRLIRIPYWKGNDIEKIISDELKLA